jgi:hypothetical protein
VTVVVVRPDRDHRHPRVDRGEEAAGVGVTTVVGHLEHRRPQARGPLEQRVRRRGLGVTRQQHRPGVGADAQHQRGVVRA